MKKMSWKYISDITDDIFIPFGGKLRGEESHDRPVLVQQPGIEEYFVPVFSTVEKLKQGMVFIGVKGYSIKKVVDSLEFITSIREVGVRVMLDPRPDLDEQITRWTELILAGEKQEFADKPERRNVVERN